MSSPIRRCSSWKPIDGRRPRCRRRRRSGRLGLRWSFIGPFETIDLNAPGGVPDYGERLGPLIHAIDQSRGRSEPWSAELMARVAEERRGVPPLDRRLMAPAGHKAKQE